MEPYYSIGVYAITIVYYIPALIKEEGLPVRVENFFNLDRIIVHCQQRRLFDDSRRAPSTLARVATTS